MVFNKNSRTFYKMHSLGNDYIYFDCFSHRILRPSALAVRLCDRRKSIGGDGVILLEKSRMADAKMRIFNADGSEAETCGNGVRCAGKFLHDIKRMKKTSLSVETGAGIAYLYLRCDRENHTQSATVKLPAAQFSPEKIPVSLPPDNNGKIVARPVKIGGITFKITCVSMGNPHCVTFDEAAARAFETLGGQIENAIVFPRKTNAEFVTVNARNDFSVRVYERGSGETYACGTGACAVAAAAVENGFADKNAEITVRMKGGVLKVKITDGATYLTGETRLSFTGKAEMP
ncbi:MAG: diaminopimelate epimerase [Candidatus Scatosoma sp.]